MGSTIDELSRDGTTLDVDSIREKFNAAVAEMGVPLAKIAPATGVAYATLSAWKNGTYGGDNQRIAADVQKWLVTREAGARMNIALPKAPSFQRTPTALAIVDVLEAAQTLPDIAIVVGGAGIGKTTAIRWYAAHASNVWVVTLEPSTRSLGAMLNEVGMAMGLPRTQSSAILSDQIRRRMTGSSGLLVIDESQNLTLECIDQLRTFHDRAEIGLVMAGNETIARRLNGEQAAADFAPLVSRVGQRFRQKGLTVKDREILIEAWGLEDEGARKLARAVAAKPGAARSMTKVLRMAYLLAGNAGRAAPNEGDVKASWEQLSEPNERRAA